MSNLTRYSCEITIEGGWAKAVMYPSASGEWVKFDDTKELLLTVRRKSVQQRKQYICPKCDRPVLRSHAGVYKCTAELDCGWTGKRPAVA